MCLLNGSVYMKLRTGNTKLWRQNGDDLCRTHRTCQQSNAQILQAKQNVNCEIPDVPDGFRKGRGTRDQIANIRWIIKKARDFQKNIYFCYIDYVKAFHCGSQQTVENSSRDGNTRPSNLYAGQEATLRPGHGKTDWFQIGKGECQGCILLPCLFNLNSEYIK